MRCRFRRMPAVIYYSLVFFQFDGDILKALVSNSACDFPPAGWMTQARWRARQTAKEELGVGGWKEDSTGEIFPEEKKTKEATSSPPSEACCHRDNATQGNSAPCIQMKLVFKLSLLLMNAYHREFSCICCVCCLQRLLIHRSETF